MFHSLRSSPDNIEQTKRCASNWAFIGRRYRRSSGLELYLLVPLRSLWDLSGYYHPLSPGDGAVHRRERDYFSAQDHLQDMAPCASATEESRE
jgi:hypothetical protein